MKKSTVALFSLVIAASVLMAVPSACDSVKGEPAIKGYDPVAYFRDGKAVKGDGAYSFQWNGKVWLLASSAHRDLFAAAPEKYAPQYRVYCAWAMITGRKAHTDPEVWKIVNGKLYLNCSEAAYEKWKTDIPGNIRKADESWRNLADKS